MNAKTNTARRNRLVLMGRSVKSRAVREGVKVIAGQWRSRPVVAKRYSHASSKSAPRGDARSRYSLHKCKTGLRVDAAQLERM